MKVLEVGVFVLDVIEVMYVDGEVLEVCVVDVEVHLRPHEGHHLAHHFRLKRYSPKTLHDICSNFPKYACINLRCRASLLPTSSRTPSAKPRRHLGSFLHKCP